MMHRFGERGGHRLKCQRKSLVLVPVFLLLLCWSGVESKAGKDLYKVCVLTSAWFELQFGSG